VTLNKSEARITVVRVPDKPGIASKIFSPISEANIDVDMIIQNSSADGSTDLTFTVPRADVKKALKLVRKTAEEIQAEDVLVALSYSGETEELLRLLETVKRVGAKLIAMTGFARSTLAQASDVVLDCRVNEEACPLNLAPTASTTAALALGDALAMALLVRKGFRQEDFAHLHPGGKLGKRLMRVEQLMHSGEELPVVGLETAMRDVIYEMSRKGKGMTCVVEADGRLAGIITDGDLRRHMGDPRVLERTAVAVMTRNPVTIDRAVLAVEALNLMEQRKITALVVVDASRRLEGVVHLHDLWRTEMF
jgi:arabinose-5-phosphate isomerase